MSKWKGYQLPEAVIGFEIPAHTPQWFRFRTTGIPDYPGGIGSSEIGKVCGYDQYPPVLAELYHHKIGTFIPEAFDNEATHHGKNLENYVALNWQHYQGTTSSYIDGFRDWDEKGRRDQDLFRKAWPVGQYLVRMDMPWLFVSCDFIIDPAAVNLRTGQVLNVSCPLEIKTMSGHQAQMWEEGIPRKYIYQVNSQMMVLGVDYGEIAVLIDGRTLKVFPFLRSDIICDEIYTKTKKFWYEHVLPGRKAYKSLMEYQKAGSALGVQQAQEFIDRYEPGPDQTQEYEKWLRKKYRRDFEKKRKVAGSFGSYQLAKELAVLNQTVKELQSRAQLRRNVLLSKMIAADVGQLVWDPDQSVKISSDDKLRINIDVDDKIIEEVISQINIKKLL